jgi:hypothetical protein
MDWHQLQKQINAINDRVDPLVGEKLHREAEELRERSRYELKSNPQLFAAVALRWLRQTDDGWVIVKRDDTSAALALPSHLKVALTSSSGAATTLPFSRECGPVLRLV